MNKQMNMKMVIKDLNDLLVRAEKKEKENVSPDSKYSPSVVKSAIFESGIECLVADYKKYYVDHFEELEGDGA